MGPVSTWQQMEISLLCWESEQLLAVRRPVPWISHLCYCSKQQKQHDELSQGHPVKLPFARGKHEHVYSWRVTKANQRSHIFLVLDGDTGWRRLVFLEEVRAITTGRMRLRSDGGEKPSFLKSTAKSLLAHVTYWCYWGNFRFAGRCQDRGRPERAAGQPDWRVPNVLRNLLSLWSRQKSFFYRTAGHHIPDRPKFMLMGGGGPSVPPFNWCYK